MATSQPCARFIRPHALLVPLPLQGHIAPMMQLSAKLALNGLLVTFANTPRNHSKIMQHSSASLSNLDIRLVQISDGLPPDNDGLNLVQIFDSCGRIGEAVEHLIEQINDGEEPISCIIADCFFNWSQDVADRLNIARVSFWASNAASFSVYLHLPLFISKGFLPLQGENHADTRRDGVINFIPGLPPLCLRDIPFAFLDSDSLPLLKCVGLMEQFERMNEAAWVLVNSFSELEGQVIDALQGNVRILPVGPLLPSAFLGNEVPITKLENRINTSLFPEDDKCLEWLENQTDCSILYIAFGSMFNLNASQVKELALGLERSDQKFLWVLHSGFQGQSVFEFLPEGFLDRICNQGLVVSWAPQLLILSHRAVGGFLSHCGWNSTVESMSMGVPLLGWPLWAEQNTTCKFIVDEWKIGMDFKKRSEDGLVDKCEVERVVRRVMQGQEGIEMRRRAAELRDAARRASNEGGSSQNGLQAFVESIATRHH